jgi:outer membrane lipoprotein carrier protein
VASRASLAIVNGGEGQSVCSCVARILFLCLLGSFCLAAATGVDQLVQRVEDRYNKAQTLAVNFEEEYSLLGHKRPPEEGTLTLRKKGKMRWDYRRPAGKVFLSDGKSAFLYTAGDNRVEKVPLKDTEDMRAPMAFLLGRLDLKKEFSKFGVRDGEGGTWLTGSAKSDRLPYKEVEMLIGPEGEIRKLNVLGRDESLLSFSFRDERVNPPVDDRIFQFEIPAGAEVVDAVEFKSQEK